MNPVDRSACGATQHGTDYAYKQHHCRCADARNAYRVYRKRIREGRHTPRLVDGTGTRRRLEALAAIRWPSSEIAERLGRRAHRSVSLLRNCKDVHVSTARRVAAVYDELSMTIGPSEKTAQYAQKHGWVPPLAWDEDTIDDPTAEPYRGAQESSTADEVALDLVSAGKLSHRKLSVADRAALVRRHWHLGPVATARLTGMPERTVQRIRARITPPADSLRERGNAA